MPSILDVAAVLDLPLLLFNFCLIFCQLPNFCHIAYKCVTYKKSVYTNAPIFKGMWTMLEWAAVSELLLVIHDYMF